MKFLITNGRIADIEEINLNQFFTDVSFRLSQKVWYGYGGIPFLSENLEQLKSQAEALRLTFPQEFEDHREIFRLTKRMLNKNRFYRSGYLQFQVVWRGNQAEILITSNAFSTFGFPFSEGGLLATFSNQKKIKQNTFNRFPYFNEMLWETGMAEIRQTPYRQVIFLNEQHAVCECAHANIFLVRENELLTPAISSGCYNDVLRPVIIDLAKKTGLKVYENENIEKSMLYESDEIFLASESLGIQWILGIENKRFLHNFSMQIHEKLSIRMHQHI